MLEIMVLLFLYRFGADCPRLRGYLMLGLAIAVAAGAAWLIGCSTFWD
jgi:hypothetical protein